MVTELKIGEVVSGGGGGGRKKEEEETRPQSHRDDNGKLIASLGEIRCIIYVPGKVIS